MSLNHLKIPESQKENFKFFLTLPDVVRNEFIEAIKKTPLGLTDSGLFNFMIDNVKNLSNDKIGSLISIYLNLSEVKDEMGYSDSEFIEDLTNALLSTGDPELIPNDESMLFFRSLFSSESNLNTSRIVQNEYLENEKNYHSSKILIDVRSIFDKDQLIGSTIINRLKLTFQENSEEKTIFISLDENDINKLISNLKNAQTQNNYIKENFKNLNLIDIIN